MAKKLKVGDVLRGYRVTKVFGPGMMAISYGAVAPAGRKIFLKQYKSPSPSVVWYRHYVDYQRELNSRIRAGRAGHFAVAQVDAFEERWGGPCYFQAYEFVEHGADLQKMLDDEREEHRRTGVAPTNDPAVWARNVTWAKVLMTGIAALHETKIVHADLKPANAYLIQDPSIIAGYQLKLIDMDFSVLADRRAPWHGHQGYVGTDNYRSPEHLIRGSVPGLASDLFTCGLMLYEILAGVHPYWQDDQGEYARLVHAHATKPPALLGMMPAPASNAEVSAALWRCLSPDPAARPTAAELRAVLSGRGAAATKSATRPAAAPTGGGYAKPTAPSARSEARPIAAAAAAPPITSDVLQIAGPDGRSVDIRLRTELGKPFARQFGPDGEFWDTRQCVLERSGGTWLLSPVPGATNETLVNGEAVASACILKEGDRIAVGRQAKGVAKLPLTVRGR